MGRLPRIWGTIRRGFGRPHGSAHAEKLWWDHDFSKPPWPDATVVEYVVDNRAFLLGLDQLYRSAMKQHERGELLACARRVTTALNVPPAHGPIEGYYTEHADLTIYFRLVRALQEVSLNRASEVESLPEFRRLLAVMSSPIFGVPHRRNLLPRGVDPLSKALGSAAHGELTVPLLITTAARVARETDDYSLVGLAARSEDAVVLTALRESVVLYAETVTIGEEPRIWPKFVWRVDPELCGAAERFVDTFNTLFGRQLPPPTAQYAHAFDGGIDDSHIVGRCVRLGQTNGASPRFYHWAVVMRQGYRLEVDEFWAPEIWTTERYRQALDGGRGVARQGFT